MSDVKIICVKITGENEEFLYNSYYKNLNLNGKTYQSGYLVNLSEIESTNSFSNDNLEINIWLNCKLLEQINGSGFDSKGEVEIYLINSENENEAEPIWKGHVGQFTICGSVIKIEARGVTYRLNNLVTKCYSPTCRAQLGDADCQVNIKDFTENAKVSKLSGKGIYLDLAYEKLVKLKNAKIKFISGKASGEVFQVKNVISGKVTFYSNQGFKLRIGDEVEISPSCDKNFQTCCNVFDNAVNFRAEPHLPGFDEILKTASSTITN